MFRRASVALWVVLVVVLIGAVGLPARAATGPDVSSWQHPNGAPLDWGEVRRAGHDFMYVKADEGPVQPGGSYYTNPYFGKDWNAAAAAGLYRGAYHYARPKLPYSTAVEDARHFISIAGTMHGPQDLPPALDLEETGDLPPYAVAQWTRTWLAEVERLTGRTPIIYVGYYFWQASVGGPGDFGRYPLWLASWSNEPSPALIPNSWQTWTFWQWTNVATSPGIASLTDMNRFCCPDSSLALLAGGGDPAFANPFGSVDAMARTPNGVQLTGWTIDPDTTASLDVHVYVDGAIAGAGRADAFRGDVGRTYPGFGDDHGFSFSVPVGPGPHVVCAYAINRGAGNANPVLGCQNLASDPVGRVDEVSFEPGGKVRVQGWVVDPDTAQPIQVGVFVDGMPWAAALASHTRPDVAHAYGMSSQHHGFSVDLDGITTVANVCVIAIDVGPGTDRILGCRSVDARRNPIGALDAVEVGDGGVRVRGWALDPDRTGPIPVHVYVDGVLQPVVTASASRPDVASVYDGWGAAHGFDVLIPNLWVSPHQVCVYAINVDAGAVNPQLGCRTVQPRGEPVGSLDMVTSTPGGARVAGWVIDPDMVYPAQVRLFVDGAPLPILTADRVRADVAAAFPFMGGWHGFDEQLALAAGPHQVCAWGINVGRGMADRLLGCRSVTVA